MNIVCNNQHNKSANYWVRNENEREATLCADCRGNLRARYHVG